MSFSGEPRTSSVSHSAAMLPTIIDLKQPCQWGFVNKNAWLREGLAYESRKDATEAIFNSLQADLEMDFNWYVVVTGMRYGAGKSDTAIFISWMFDSAFSLENCLFYDIPQLASLVEKRKRDCTLAWDEPQDQINAVDWAQIPETTRRMISSQRENKINIVFATQDMLGIAYMVRRAYNYLFHITYRCKDHIHGYVFRRSGSPWFPEDPVMVGNFTIPKPTDPFLVSEIQRYHREFKTPYTTKAQEDFAQEELHGGLTLKHYEEFIAWWQKQPHKMGQRIVKDMVRLWAIRHAKHLTDEQIGEIYAEATLYVQDEKEKLARQVTIEHNARVRAEKKGGKQQ